MRRIILSGQWFPSISAKYLKRHLAWICSFTYTFFFLEKKWQFRIPDKQNQKYVYLFMCTHYKEELKENLRKCIKDKFNTSININIFRPSVYWYYHWFNASYQHAESHMENPNVEQCANIICVTTIKVTLCNEKCRCR